MCTDTHIRTCLIGAVDTTDENNGGWESWWGKLTERIDENIINRGIKISLPSRSLSETPGLWVLTHGLLESPPPVLCWDLVGCGCCCLASWEDSCAMVICCWYNARAWGIACCLPSNPGRLSSPATDISGIFKQRHKMFFSFFGQYLTPLALTPCHIIISYHIYLSWYFKLTIIL